MGTPDWTRLLPAVPHLSPRLWPHGVTWPCKLCLRKDGSTGVVEQISYDMLYSLAAVRITQMGHTFAATTLRLKDPKTDYDVPAERHQTMYPVNLEEDEDVDELPGGEGGD